MYIFDIDGTLLYTIDTIRYFLNKTLEDFCLGELPKERVEEFVGNGHKVLVDKALSYLKVGRGEDFNKKVLDAYNLAYASDPAYLTRPYEGIREVLDIFKKRGEILACFSNKNDELCQKVIKENFGQDFFDMVLGYRDDYERKPAPDGINIIKERLGVSYSDIIYFGDSEVDIACGKNAGVFTVACSWGFRDRDLLMSKNPDLIIDSPEEMNIRRA